jgi:hypothetical protein
VLARGLTRYGHLKELIKFCFTEKYGKLRCKYLALGRDESYFAQENTPILFCIYPDKEWSFQDGGLYIIKKVGVTILTIIVLYRLS